MNSTELTVNRIFDLIVPVNVRNFMLASQKETTMNATLNTQYTAALDYARTVDSSIARVSSESYECSYCSHKQAYTAFDASGLERFSFCLDCVADADDADDDE